MQDARFEIDPNGGFVVLGDETYVKADNEFNMTIMKNPVSGNEVLIEEFVGTSDDVETYKHLIFDKISDSLNISFDDDAENAEFIIGEKIKEIREFNNILYPFTYEVKTGLENSSKIVTATELPNNYTTRYISLRKFFEVENVPLSMRIVVSINLTEIFILLSQHFSDLIYSLNSDDFYINKENGNTVFLFDKCLVNDRIQVRNNKYSVSSDMGGTETEGSIGKKDLIGIIQFVTFKILCSGNPFDSKNALVEHPYYSEDVERSINTGKYGFVFDTVRKNYSPYANAGMLMRYKAFPKFVTSEFEKAFTVDDETDDVYDWLFIMRKLRDCLVFVNNKFVLCDPDSDNNVLFMEIGDYKIPVWPKKAVYWYHVGMNFDETQNGVVAGINADGTIENCTEKAWAVQYDGNVFFVEKGKNVKPVDKLTITFDSSIKMKIVDGKKKATVQDDVIDIPTVTLDDDKSVSSDTDVTDAENIGAGLTDNNKSSEAAE